MIDELWENDGDVGDAFLAGADAVVDAGEAIGAWVERSSTASVDCSIEDQDNDERAAAQVGPLLGGYDE